MSRASVLELINQSQALPSGPERVALVEEAVRIAEASCDEELSYQAHLELVETATWSGLGDRALVAFAWCLAYYDRQAGISGEGHCSQDTLLWQFKWALRSLPETPKASLDQILRMEVELATRLEDAGYNARTINYIRCMNRLDFGDLAAAPTYYEKWQAIARDALADCLACELDGEVTYYAALRQDEKAVRLAMKLISGERPGCREVPHRTYAKIILPLLRLDRLEEAAQIHRDGIRKLSRLPNRARDVAQHLIYLVRVGDVARAMQLLDRYLTRQSVSANFHSLIDVQNAAALTLEAVANRSNRKRKLRLPMFLPCYREDHTYDVPELANWFRATAANLAAQFDARNGNDRFARMIAETRQLAHL